MAPDSPLHETLWRFAAPRGATSLGADTELAPTGEAGWIDLDALVDDSAAFDAIVDLVAASWSTQRRDIAGAGWLSDCAFALLLRGAVAFLGARRVPALDAPGAAVRLDADAWVERVALGPRFACLPGDPAAGHPQATVVDGELVLLRELLTSFEARHERTVEQVAERCRRPRAALWRHGGDTVAEAFMWAGEVVGERDAAWAWGRKALELAPPRLRSHGSFRVFRHGAYEQVGRVRAQCCLNYRTGDATYCFSCPLQGEDHRRAVLARTAAEEAAA